MFRFSSFTLLLFIMSAIYLNICFGQTFQYSRGWTNGKRSQSIIDNFNQQQQQHMPRYLSKEENALPSELYDDRLLERCLLRMRNVLGRTALYSNVFTASRPTPTNSNSNPNPNNNVESNNSNHHNNHQSSELFDELNGAMETNDYAKH